MKVGILTYHFSDNYGALFQAYALRQWFISNGHDASFINYHPDYLEDGGKFNFLCPFSKNNLKIAFLKLSRMKENFFGDKRQHRNFELFRKEMLGVVGPVFKHANELDNIVDDYDLLITGSDQVWNPSEHFGVDRVYFLNFYRYKPTSLRVSYAPSFGRDFIGDKYKSLISELIADLDSISVRELSGVNIVKELTGNEPTLVPDPTILLTDYSNIIKPYPLDSKNHIFCYTLRSRALIGDIAETIASKLCANLYSPHNPHRRWKEIGETVYPCPSQWLYLLSTSKFVVTNSFHGTALSIILNKPFVVVGLQGGKSDFNARSLNLLSLVGLSDRFIKDAKVDFESLINSPIDWTSVNSRVAELRKLGVDFLNENLVRLSK